MSYASVKLPTPATLEGTSPKPTLIIGSGHSTKLIADKKEILPKYFGNIIVLNYSFQWFDDIITHHIVTEKTSPTSVNMVHKRFYDKTYRTDVPRIVNWKGIDQYPKQYNLYKCTRAPFYDGFDVTKYGSGFLTGNKSHQGFALGSSTLCAMHLARLLGSQDIYLIGADLLFRDDSDHWYKDRAYRNPEEHFPNQKAEHKHKIVSVKLKDSEYLTTAYFRDSAKCIDDMIVGPFKDTKVYDFSDGLITTAIPLKVDKFFDKGVI